MDKVRIGLIGCGGIANGKHLPAYKANDRAELVAFCDIIVERAEKACRVTAKSLGSFLTDWSIYHTCLTEATASDASAVGFKNDTVVNGFDIRHNELLGIGNLIKILDDSLLDLGGGVLVLRLVLLDGAVLVIGYLVE